MVLGSIQPLTQMSTRNLPEGKEGPARKADLTAICEPIVEKMWEPRRLTILWAFTVCYRGSFTLTVHNLQTIFCPFFIHYRVIVPFSERVPVRSPNHTKLVHFLRGENIRILKY
jgi:hypothetical protein